VAAAAVALSAAVAAAVGWWPVPAADTTRPAAGDPLDGATLFRTKGCATCHDGPDRTAAIDLAPDLSDAGSWAGDRRPGTSAEGYLTESVRAPGEFTSPAFASTGGPTGGMPVLQVSDAEIEALIDYLLPD